jgi:hypothetical protein
LCDDVLLLSNGSESEGKVFQDILQLYCKASGMEVNVLKSAVGFMELREEVVARLQEAFPFAPLYYWGGFKYLGLILKPNGSSRRLANMRGGLPTMHVRVHHPHQPPTQRK